MKPYGELTRLGQLRRIRRLAEAALDLYGLGGARLTCLQYSANIVYRVDVPGPAPAGNGSGPYVPMGLPVHQKRPRPPGRARSLAGKRWGQIAALP